MLHLPDVTLCAADSVNLALTHRALQQSMGQCSFHEAILFSDKPQYGDYRTEPVEPFRTVADYSSFLFKQLAPHITTSHALIVQWDGYVVDPTMWSADFLNYDYIGAPWHHFDDDMIIGNGGFSLRSRKLLLALQDVRLQFLPAENEDVLICRRYRRLLETEFDIRFAPSGIADSFSYENALPTRATFGFHGLRNLWRYVDDVEMLALIDLLPAYVLRTPHCVALAFDLLQQHKTMPLIMLYQKIRAHLEEAEISEAFCVLAGDAAAAPEFLQSCDRALANHKA